MYAYLIISICIVRGKFFSRRVNVLCVFFCSLLSVDICIIGEIIFFKILYIYFKVFFWVGGSRFCIYYFKVFDVIN